MSVVPKDAFFALRPDVRYRPMPSGGMLVNLSTGACFELNRAGADLWTRLAGGATLGRAIGALRDTYDAAPDVIEADFLRLCGALLAEGLVEPRPGTPVK
jgi:Coenzyme PQQ synthesis protein D (PqqD)